MSIEKESKLLKVVKYILVAIFLLFLLFPLYWMLVTSFKDNSVLFKIPPEWIPLEPILLHYKKLFSDLVFVKYYINTLIVTIGATFLTLIVATLAGYGFSRYTFKIKDLSLFLILSTQML